MIVILLFSVPPCLRGDFIWAQSSMPFGAPKVPLSSTQGATTLGRAWVAVRQPADSDPAVRELVDKLNPAQREAATYLDGPLMIIAGAGTGKTRVITHRIAFLSREVGIPLNQILAVTFTNKAAKEMRERVCHLLGVPDSPGLAIGTFHSRCALILRREADAAGLDQNFAILDENDQRQAIKRVLKEMNISEKRARPQQVQTFINQAKMRLLTPQDCRAEFDEEDVPYADIYEQYQKVLTQAKSIDFEDLMMRTVVLFRDNEQARQRWANRYHYVMVDEYQDTNHAQFLLSKLLAQDHRQICIVGDEDQSIYSWRGAEISNLLDFEKAFPGTHIVKLEHNYRSTANILKAASTVIAHNTQRIGKELFTTDAEGELLSFIASRDQDEEARRIAQECTRLTMAEGVNPDQIAIFYRGHWLSRAVEDQMRQFRLPYRMVGGLRFYDRAEIKDLLSFLRLAVNPDDNLAFERVLNTPTRGIGPKAQSQIEIEAARLGVSWMRATHRLLQQEELKGTARRGAEAFINAIDAWCSLAEHADPVDVLDRILLDTNYRNDGIADPKSIEGESKLENIEEFRGLMATFRPTGEGPPLAEFLTAMALDATEEKDDGRPRINLLTIHNAKGLEYDYVFTIGLEKGVFPTSRAEDSMEAYAVEEERRLFYVAITRARKKLYLSYAYQRNRPDFWQSTQPSRFLLELPPSVFDSESLRYMKRLVPYGWGNNPERGGANANVDRELVYTPAEDATEAPGRAYSQYIRNMAAPRPAPPSGAKPKFTVGTRVLHRHLGSGVISEIGGRPGWERAVIDFDDGRSQEFVLKYAPITAE
ncbi:AAA family ATPase [bacterium]|nr:AAA family ATPase [bacterium]